MSTNFVENSNNNLSIVDFSKKLGKLKQFLRERMKKIVLMAFLGGVFGFVMAFISPTKYVSRVSFIVEEGKGVGGGISALAGQFGLDLGGNASNGLFSGENIMLFLRSESLARQTLLSPYDDSAQTTLADRYAEVMGLKKKWKKSLNGRDISFAHYAKSEMPRLEDSLLQFIIKKEILSKCLVISRPDKKSSFIQILMSSRDEKLSFIFSQRLLKIATEKYIESKTKVKVQNLNALQKRADSLSQILNSKTQTSASFQQNLVDINPALKTAPVSTEVSVREKNMVATIFAEVVKNLEVAKTMLSQETPAIQVIDISHLPLEKVESSMIKLIFSWSGIFAFLYSFYSVIRKWFEVQLRS